MKIEIRSFCTWELNDGATLELFQLDKDVSISKSRRPFVSISLSIEEARKIAKELLVNADEAERLQEGTKYI